LRSLPGRTKFFGIQGDRFLVGVNAAADKGLGQGDKMVYLQQFG
jgi:hypothetical protein